MKSFSFFDAPKQYVSNKKIFGLCDKEPPPHLPAYLDENNGKEWIAAVDNYYQSKVTFIALDNCIHLKKADGKPDKCCDGLLTYNSTVIFVELTTRTDGLWRKEKETQLKVTIKHFEVTKESDTYKVKKAYIANSKKPLFSRGQEVRINNFWKDTGYVLRIQNRIEIR